MKQGGLQWGRDVSAAEINGIWLEDRVKQGFNGAATFPPRKCAEHHGAIAQLTSLQWGRDVSAAEMQTVWEGRSS